MILKGISILPKGRKNKGFARYTDPYYHSKEWKQLRQQKLTLSPLCEDCLELETPYRITEGKVVDHIIPRKQGGKDELSNLRTRCVRHNAIKTALDNPNNL